MIILRQKQYTSLGRKIGAGVGRFTNFDPVEFERQKTRDNNVRNYCINNNICLIEIPFILSSYKSISIFLTKVIFDEVDPNSIIDYEKIYNGESTIKSIDLMNIF